jgi:hypothetical protein
VRRPIEQVLVALEEAEVEYIVVGGVAVVLHGYLRTTADLDIVLRLDDTNIRRAISALCELGFQSRLPVPVEHFALREHRRDWVENKGMTVFSLWSPSIPGFAVDLFAEEPFDFAEVYKRATRVPLAGVSAVVIGLADLIEMKRSAGRSRDQDDILHLQALSEAVDDQEEHD